MNWLLSPAALGLLALGPLIVVFYLLKLKRYSQQVPSTLLWRRSVQDMVANAPFQRLRNNLLLWLQLLALLLLVIALARPVARIGELKGETIIVLLDLSASMQTREADGRTRLDQAKKIALEAVDSMSGGTGVWSAFAARDEMMVIGFAERTFPLQTMTTDRGALRTAIQQAEASDTESNVEDAGLILQEKTMDVREGAMVPNPNARVLLISDGTIGPTIDSLSDVKRVSYIKVGETDDNTGFIAADLRESFSGDFEQQIFASLHNSRAVERDAFVELVLGTTVADLKKVTIPAKGSASVLFGLAEEYSGPATLRLADHRDALPVDDQIELQVQQRTQLRVLLVTTGNPFLEKVLRIDPRATVEVLRPTDYDNREGYELVVFDRWAPATIGAGNFLFVNSLPPAEFGFSANGTVERPQLVDWSRTHPLTRYCGFETVAVAEAMKMTIPKEATPLVEAVETPVMAVLESDARRIMVIGFDILKSYWPLEVSFPIMFGNLLDQWSRGGKGLGRAVWSTGSTVAIPVPCEATSATVKTPSGGKTPMAVEGLGSLYITETQRRGLYEVDFAGAEIAKRFSVALLSPLESGIEPSEVLEVGGETLISTPGDAGGRGEVWPWIVLFGVLVLFGEWVIYCRRAFL
jgi:hypothetical protein